MKRNNYTTWNLAQIEKEITSTKESITAVEEEIDDLEYDLSGLKDRIGNLEDDLEALEHAKDLKTLGDYETLTMFANDPAVKLSGATMDRIEKVIKGEPLYSHNSMLELKQQLRNNGYTTQTI
jgi:septal ring factor EnvC (AmiA/AmiB activator)